MLKDHTLPQDQLAARRSIEKSTAFLMWDFGRLVVDAFQGLTVIDDVIDKLNWLCNDQYQYSIKSTLDSTQIRDKGELNCVTVAILIGLWRIMSSQEDHEPTYYVKKPTTRDRHELFDSLSVQTPTRKTKVHSWIAVPTKNGIRHIQGWERSRYLPDSFAINDVPQEFLTKNIQHADSIRNTATFVANRVSVLGTNGRIRQRAQLHYEEYQHFIGNYPVTIESLREMYQGARSAY